MGGIVIFGAVFILIGIAGFTRRGLPWRSKRRIRGKAGRYIGAVCIAFGLSLVAAGLWWANPGQREVLAWLFLGVFIGSLGTWLALQGVWP